MHSTNSPPSPEIPFPIAPKPAYQDVSNTPPLPPLMDSVQSHSTDELVRMMKKIPLFMTNLDEAGGTDGEEENIQVEALRALQYEGTRAEIALGFKERGNEMVAEKRWKDAKEFYTKGILALKASMDADINTTEGDEEAEILKEKQVEEACYVNRSLCNLELQNYRSTLTDTAHALSLSPSSQKALYRSSLALLHLSRHTHALDACTRGLALTNPSKSASAQHTAFLALRTRILDAQKTFTEAEHKRVSEKERKKKEQLCLSAALHARGIKVRMSPHPPDLEDARIFLGPDPLKATSRLFFPVLVLYPVHGQSDFLKAVEETEGWGGVLGVVLGGEGEGVGQGGNEKGKGGRQGMDEEGKGGNRLPWDKEGEYTVDGVESFMETKEGGMVKVGRKVRLLDVLAGGKVEVVDGVVRGFVVPKARVGAWVEEMKGRKGR